MKDLVDEYIFYKNNEVEIVLKLVKLNNKYKEVLDKIKDVILYKYPVLDENMDDLKQEIYKLLEEI